MGVTLGQGLTTSTLANNGGTHHVEGGYMMSFKQTLKLMTYGYAAAVTAVRVIRAVRTAKKAYTVIRMGLPLVRQARRLTRVV